MSGQGLASEAAATSDAGSPAELSGLGGMLGLGNTRNWGVIFSYLTSKWAMSCLAVVSRSSHRRAVSHLGWFGEDH